MMIEVMRISSEFGLLVDNSVSNKSGGMKQKSLLIEYPNDYFPNHYLLKYANSSFLSLVLCVGYCLKPEEAQRDGHLVTT